MWKLFLNDNLVATQSGDYMKSLSPLSPYDLFDFGFEKVSLSDFLFWVATDLGLSTSIKKSELKDKVLDTTFGLRTRSGYVVKYDKQ